MTISEWEQAGQPWDAGRQLLKKLDPGTHFNQTFERQGPTPYNVMKLLHLLRRIEQEKPRPGSNPQPVKRVRHYEPLPMGADISMDPFYPEPVAEAIERRAKLVNRRNRLSNDLLGMPDDAARAQAREEIQECQAQIAQYSDLIDTWKKTKKVPELKKNLPPLPPHLMADLETRLAQARKRLNKQVWLLKQVHDTADMPELKRAWKIQYHTTAIEEQKAVIADLLKQMGKPPK